MGSLGCFSINHVQNSVAPTLFNVCKNKLGINITSSSWHLYHRPGHIAGNDCHDCHYHEDDVDVASDDQGDGHCYVVHRHES